MVQLNLLQGLNFQPDFVWFKSRGEAQNHYLFDKIRGVTKSLTSDITDSEQTYSTTLTSFNSDGVTIGDSTRINKNTFNHVAWNWLANGAGSANTDGSISSTVSANTTSGFSIVSYTGTGSVATVGHGLGVAPKMILFKNRTTASNWLVYHEAIGNTHNLYLDATNAKADRSDTFNDTSPTSSVFTVGTADLNTSGNSIIAYCFAEKQGYSKFGSYTGNGNADGTFVYTGFKPAFILIKQTNAVGAWYMWDNKRDTINPYQKYLIPNGTNVEYSGSERWLDSLSNGFKWRNTETAMNDSGATYIYMAFAEEPLVGDNPATAR
jgi:hypothetical protein